MKDKKIFLSLVYDTREFSDAEIAKTLKGVLQDGTLEYFILPNYVWVNGHRQRQLTMFFHSDVTPNLAMLRKFSRFNKNGMADNFVCCFPNTLPNSFKRYHLLNDCYGPIHSCGELGMKDKHLHVYSVWGRKRR